MDKKRIIVILPVYNEAGKIGNVVKKIHTDVPKNLVDEVLVVNDGSTDATSEEARSQGAVVIDMPVNKGVGSGIRAGIKYAQQKKYDIIVIMAGDDQDVPAELPFVVAPIIEEGFDFVQGSRRYKDRQTVNMPLFRRITTKLYSVFFTVLTGFNCSDGTNGFRAFTSEFTKDKKMDIDQKWLNTYELEPYLLYHAVTLKYKVKEVQVTKVYHSKEKGYSKMQPFTDWWNILKPLIYLRFGIKR